MLYERWDVVQNLIELNKITDKIKDYLKDFDSHYNILLNDYRIITNFDYYRYVRDLIVNPNDAFVYIGIDFGNSDLITQFPFIANDFLILNAYLSKQGFHYQNYVVPASGLRYVAIARLQQRKAFIEILELDKTAIKLNIPRIVTKALADKSTRELGSIDLYKLTKLFDSQKILAGHSINEAFTIFVNYYDRKDEIKRIIYDYNRIFIPLYKACYDMETWDRIDCPSFNFETLI